MTATLPGSTVPTLERLTQLNVVDVHQITVGYHGNNYTVLSEDEPLFTMFQYFPDTIPRGRALRAFMYDGVDNIGRKMFRFHRPSTSWSLSREVELFMDDHLTSIIRWEVTCCTLIFTISDPQEQTIARLKKAGFCKASIFQLQGNANVHIGGIYRKRSGWRDYFSSYHDFTINFPAELAVQYKIAVIVACVYIDLELRAQATETQKTGRATTF